MSCDAKIRPFRGVNETELTCDRTISHRVHRGKLYDYAYAGSVQTITWYEQDRRNFTGKFIECPEEGCLLPIRHHGHHVPFELPATPPRLP
jgi:hypothetical protein